MKCPSTLAYSSDLPMPYPALAVPNDNLSMPYLSLVMSHPSLRYATPHTHKKTLYLFKNNESFVIFQGAM
jgi:hypothetical protein